MVGSLCCVLPHDYSSPRAFSCWRRNRGLRWNDFDEGCAADSRSFQWLRVAGIGDLGIHRCRAGLAEAGAFDCFRVVILRRGIRVNRRVNVLVGAIAFVILLTCSLGFSQAEPSFDLVITNGHIIDGTGSPWYSGDIGISNGKITAIGNLSEAARKRTIDARGMVVAPGFIDMLGQSETTILVDPRLPSKIYQGITTEITGEGNSIAPLNDAILRADQEQYDHYHIQVDWRTFREYFSRLEKQRIGINLASYVGATSVRRMVLGDNDVQPTPAQLEDMKEFVSQAMRDGAVGVSTSLEYAPAPYAKTEELIADRK